MKIIITFFLTFQSIILFGQNYEFSANCKQAYIDIISLEFEQGAQLLMAEKNQNPENLLPVLYESYIDFLKVVLGENESEYEKFKEQKRVRLRALSEGEEDSPYYRYALANIYLQYAFARLHFKENFKAMFEIKRAYRLLVNNVEEYPDFIPNLIGMGLLHSLIGSIPDNYKWLSWLANMSGSVEQGMSELYRVLKEVEKGGSYSYLLTEAAFYLTFMEINLNIDKSSIENLIEILNKQDSDTPLTLYAKVSVYMRTNRNEKAIKLLDNYQASSTAFKFHYFEYLHGLAYLNKLDNRAIEYFERYLKNFKGDSYKKSAYQKIAWLKLLDGDTLGYKKQISNCLEVGNSNLEGDKQAEQEAEDGFIPNFHLIKARLLYDGGYYEKSLKVLDDNRYQVNVNNKVQLTELLYRYGRNYQMLKKYVSAKHYFKRAINLGKNLDEYYAGNSCIQLGSICEIQQKPDSANYYYQKCLDLDFRTYKMSLDFKAKAKMKELEIKKGS